MLSIFNAKNIQNRLTWYLAAIGVFFQINHYLDNLSLWGDEAWLALDLIRRSLSEIFFNKNLSPYYSTPPVGFLLIEKNFMFLFGSNECAFRLFPFICGLTSIFLYRNLLKNYFTSTVTIIALLFFIFCNPWIFYSAQLKQYSSDVLITMIIYSLIFNYLLKPMRLSHLILLSLAGVFCLIFSHPSILIMGGIALAQIVLLQGNRKLLKRHMVVYFSWFLCFSALYLIYFHSNFANARMMSYQNENFLNITQFQQLGAKILGVFNNPAGLSFSGLVFSVFLIGIFQSFKTNNKVALQLIMPLILTVVAAFLHKYPFHGRFLLFAIPILFIFIAEGFTFLFERKIFGSILSISLLLLVLVQPISEACLHVINPRYIAEIRPLLTYLKSKQQKGDSLYLNNEAQYAYAYYTHTLNYRTVPRILGIFNDHLDTDDEKDFLYIFHENYNIDSRIYASGQLASGKVNPDKHHLTKLEGKGRVWILFSQADRQVEEYFIRVLRNNGIEIDHRKSYGADLYLFDFREN